MDSQCGPPLLNWYGGPRRTSSPTRTCGSLTPSAPRWPTPSRSTTPTGASTTREFKVRLDRAMGAKTRADLNGLLVTCHPCTPKQVNAPAGRRATGVVGVHGVRARVRSRSESQRSLVDAPRPVVPGVRRALHRVEVGPAAHHHHHHDRARRKLLGRRTRLPFRTRLRAPGNAELSGLFELRQPAGGRREHLVCHAPTRARTGSEPATGSASIACSTRLLSPSSAASTVSSCDATTLRRCSDGRARRRDVARPDLPVFDRSPCTRRRRPREGRSPGPCSAGSSAATRCLPLTTASMQRCDELARDGHCGDLPTLLELARHLVVFGLVLAVARQSRSGGLPSRARSPRLR